MKKFLYVILGLGVIYLILCFVGPSSVTVQRSIEINAPKELVQKQLTNFKFFHDVWSPWSALDSAMKTNYTGEVGQPGYCYAWESENSNVGKGSMTYNSTVNDSILMTLHFEGMGNSKIYYVTSDSNNATKVLWGVNFEVGFIGRGFMLFVNFDKSLGTDFFEKGLAKLKPALEKLSSVPAPANYEIKEMQWEAKTFYGKKEKLSFDKIAGFFGENFSKLGAELGKLNIQPIGMPKAIYFTFDESTMITDCAAVMEVPNDAKVNGWEKFESPAGKVLLIEYFGAYEKSAEAHYAMDAYIKKNNLTSGLVLEEYVSDPMTEKDTAKWQTNIFYLLK